jgi:hypothetical protein
MRCVKADELFVVFDDVLSSEAARHLWKFVQEDTYTSVHKDAWTKVWRLSDGSPMKGTQVMRMADEAQSPDDGAPGLLIYPSGTALDALLDVVVQQASFVGQPVADWHSVGAATWLYPQGAGLSWHTDGRVHVGAFIYYAHPYWNCQWGGELLLADVSLEDRANWQRGSTLENTWENTHLSEHGWGHYVMPKPNRLVLLKGGVPHKLQRVDTNAGDHVRATVAGFFMRAGTP